MPSSISAGQALVRNSSILNRRSVCSETRTHSVVRRKSTIENDGFVAEGMGIENSTAMMKGGDDFDSDEVYSCMERMRGILDNLVQSNTFEAVFAVLILMNAVFIGLETDCGSRCPFTFIFEAGHLFFTVAFSFELLLKVTSYRMDFFVGKDKYWNLLDVVLVSEMIGDTLNTLSLARCRILRIIRIFRIARLSRIFRYLPELRTIIVALLSALQSVSWAVFLLFMVIYVVAILITQGVIEYMEQDDVTEVGMKNKEIDDLIYYFGSLSKTVITLFECITSGVSWDSVYMALRTNISPWAGFALCMYICFTLFALLNVVTGVVVENASMYTRAEQERVATECICRAFQLTSDDPTKTILLPEFTISAQSGIMKDYFESLDVDTSEAKFVFDLIDSDASGALTNNELLTGLMRLRGDAKALQVALVLQDCRVIIQCLRAHTVVWDELADDVKFILDAVEEIRSTTDFLCRSRDQRRSQSEVHRQISEESAGSS